jgi:hypothetical protein
MVILTLCSCTEQTLPQFGDPIPLSVPSDKAALGPRLTQAAQDQVVLSWMEKDKDSSTLRFAPFDIDTWGTAATVATDTAMFVNWADLPAVSALGANAFLAHWLSYTADETYSYQVLTSRSDDNGATWSKPTAPHNDGTPTEHGFVSSFAAPNGTGLIWLDGRETPDRGMTLRGATLTAAGGLEDEVVIDDLVCDCCQTDVATTDDGQIAVYRNRTRDEVRDIYVTRRIDGQWQPGRAISDDGWVISGCPVNGPSIAAQGKQVAVAWFTAANDEAKVQVAVSTNSGQSFSTPIVIASDAVLGRVGIVMIDRNTAAVSWLETDRKGTYSIRLRALTFDGQLGRVETVGRTSLARTVPQLVRIGDELALAWTDEIMDESKVASVKVQILGFYE